MYTAQHDWWAALEASGKAVAQTLDVHEFDLYQWRGRDKNTITHAKGLLLYLLRDLGWTTDDLATVLLRNKPVSASRHSTLHAALRRATIRINGSKQAENEMRSARDRRNVLLAKYLENKVRANRAQ
jgi:predicted dehydrogenase